MDRALICTDDPGLWTQTITSRDLANRPSLFLDRDGVIVEEVHFLRRSQDVRLIPGVAGAIAEANAAGVPVVIVTNQSGIARGHFGWSDFAAVQAEILRRLAVQGAGIDAVFACAHHESGTPPLGVSGHSWRKPGPGMILAARDLLGVDLRRSAIVGDRMSDLEAGRNAGLASGTLVLTGYGLQNVASFEARRPGWERDGFRVSRVESPSSAINAAVMMMAL